MQTQWTCGLMCGMKKTYQDETEALNEQEVEDEKGQYDSDPDDRNGEPQGQGESAQSLGANGSHWCEERLFN